MSFKRKKELHFQYKRNLSHSSLNLIEHEDSAETNDEAASLLTNQKRSISTVPKSFSHQSNLTDLASEMHTVNTGETMFNLSYK